MNSILSVVAVLGVGSIVAALISRRTSISNDRQAWIDALRDDIATFLKDLTVMHDIIHASRMPAVLPEQIRAREAERQNARTAVIFVYWRIILRLNRVEQMHIEPKDRLEAMMNVRDRVPDEQQVQAVVDLTRRILKREWEVTKYGTLRGPITLMKRRIWGVQT